MNIATWNSNGLASRSHELKTFLKSENIDIMLISETHFTKKNYLKIYNYNIYTTNHPDAKAHGGTANIIKYNIEHFENTQTSTDYIQATSVTVKDTIGYITFSAIYCPPRFSINQEKFTEFFKTLGNRFLAGGDYNAKHPWWGSRSISPNPKGKQLYLTILSEGLTPISTGEPTYWPSDTKKLPDLIDFAIIKGIDKKRFTAESCFDLSSDHSPIIIKMDSQIKNKHINNLPYNKQTNWVLYREILNEKINCNISLKSNTELENAIENLNVNIHKALHIATPHNKLQLKVINLPQEIIKIKRKLRAIWQRNRSKHNKRIFNAATRDLKNSIKENINNNIQNYLEKLSPTANTDYSLWKATRKINRPQKFIAPLKGDDGAWVREDIKKS